ARSRGPSGDPKESTPLRRTIGRCRLNRQPQGEKGSLMPDYDPLRVAIVGCGNISGGYGNGLKTKPHKVRLIGATDVDSTRSRAFVETHGGTAYPDLSAVLADPKVEAIINLTIHHAHAEVTCAALAAGK